MTDFVRDVSVKDSIIVKSGMKGTLDVNHVYSSINLPISFSIDLRQKFGSELTFVTLTNSISSTNVEIDATFLPTGEYTLVLEAFDSGYAFEGLSLKTDTVTVFVTKNLVNCSGILTPPAI